MNNGLINVDGFRAWQMVPGSGGLNNTGGGSVFIQRGKNISRVADSQYHKCVIYFNAANFEIEL